MVSFATLVFGLVFGIVDIEVRAPAATERVELLLNEESVAQLRRPFSGAVDLGAVPVPGELVAVATDAEGRELGRCSQRINTPRANARARFVREPDDENGRAVARLTWSCPTDAPPSSVAVTLDGRTIPDAAPDRIVVPAADPSRPRLLRAVVECGRDVRAVAEIGIGGDRPDIPSERTAVAVELDAGATLPAADGLAGWFAAESGPLRASAVGEAGLDVVFVCEPSAFDHLRRVFSKRTGQGRSPAKEDQQFRFLLPVGGGAPGSGALGGGGAGFSASTWFQRKWWAIGPTLAGLEVGDAFAPGQRISEAVALAGFAAAGRERRRAVVLLLGPAAQDVSELSPAAAARFLAALNVPLFAWSVGPSSSPIEEMWNARRRVSTAAEFRAALSDLREDLLRQRIVWVEGSHLPQDVELGPLAKGIRLAR
ncbi:MAG: hypothetical protein ACYC4P_02785 [Thermoanaerobaculia bacterium]